MHASCDPVFPGRQVRLTTTAKPITPFGGLVNLIAFFGKIGLAGQIITKWSHSTVSNIGVTSGRRLG